MSFYYHVTSQKATAVSHSFTCNFTGPEDFNLIIGKCFYFEIYLITPQGLRLMKVLPINGKISAATHFKRQGKKQDSIIVATEKADAAIIDCYKKGDDIVEFFTFASGNIGDSCSISSDWKHEIIVDPTSQIILFKFFDGIFKAILMKDLRDNNTDTKSQSLNIYAFRVEDGHIKGIFSLQGAKDQATIGFFVEDNKVLNMKSVKMSYSQVDIHPDEWKIDALPPDTQFIIPVYNQYYGILIVGNKHVCYYNKDGVQIPADIPSNKSSTISCYGKMDNEHYLLGDVLGHLYMLYLSHDGVIGGASSTSKSSNPPNSLQIKLLGNVCIPETISYLDNGVVFIGSTLGDSQLVRINADEVGHGRAGLQVLQSFTNVGPIMDIELLEVNGQNQLLLCSGACKEGSIKIVRNGIGIQELLSVDQPDMQAVWSLKLKECCVMSDILVFSWEDNTSCVRIEDDTMLQYSIDGFETSQYTILLATLPDQCTVLQITDREIRFISLLPDTNSSSLDINDNEKMCVSSQCSNQGLLYSWKPSLTNDSNNYISTASYDNNSVAVCCGNMLYYFKIDASGTGNYLQEIAHTKLHDEISCINLSMSTLPNVAAVTFWTDKTVVLINLSTMQIITKSMIHTNGILVQSILIVQFQNSPLPYLMIGMDNGNLVYFQIDLDALNKMNTENILTEQRRVTIGTGPYMNLSLWDSIGQTQGNCVFVCSNHPSIIHCSEGRLLFSSINLKNEVVAMCPINSKQYENCLVLVSETNIILGSIDKIQKLHVRSIPLGEAVRRMAIHRESDTLGIITMRYDTYAESGTYKPVYESVTTNPKIPNSASVKAHMNKKTNYRKIRDVESSHFVLLKQSTLEPLHIHSFILDEDIHEQATCITTMRLPISLVNNEIVSLPGSQITSPNNTGEADNDSLKKNLGELQQGSSTSVPLGSTEFDLDESIRTRDVKWETVYVVGTVFINDEENEPSEGTIYIFYYNERKGGQMSLLKKFRIYGTPFALQDFDGKLLMTVNSSVQLVDVSKQELQVISRYDDNIMALYLKRRDDFILMGDLMRSVTLLRYKPNTAHLELIARHRAPHWTTAIEIIDDDKFLVAEGEMNMFVVSRDFFSVSVPVNNTDNSTNNRTASNQNTPTGAISSSNATSGDSNVTSRPSATSATPNKTVSVMKEERFRMSEYASIHTGQVINKFISGNILMQPLLDEYSIKLKNPVLYGSTTGTIGQVFEINKNLYTFLKAVENQMQAVLVPIGNFSHETWRSVVKIRQCKVPERFIDGDLVENFQNLEQDDKVKIVKDLQIPVDFANEIAGFKDCTVDDLNRVIEEISRFH